MLHILRFHSISNYKFAQTRLLDSSESSKKTSCLLSNRPVSKISSPPFDKTATSRANCACKSSSSRSAVSHSSHSSPDSGDNPIIFEAGCRRRIGDFSSCRCAHNRSSSISRYGGTRIGVTQPLICRSLSFFDLDTFHVGLSVLPPPPWQNDTQPIARPIRGWKGELRRAYREAYWLRARRFNWFFIEINPSRDTVSRRLDTSTLPDRDSLIVPRRKIRPGISSRILHPDYSEFNSAQEFISMEVWCGRGGGGNWDVLR